MFDYSCKDCGAEVHVDGEIITRTCDCKDSVILANRFACLFGETEMNDEKPSFFKKLFEILRNVSKH